VTRRALHGFGLALMLASPLWLTLQEQPSYFNFGISLVLGICLLVLAGHFPEEKKRD
jgi:multisubunit Na+/H+ antiporter MnhE subunit